MIQDTSSEKDKKIVDGFFSIFPMFGFMMKSWLKAILIIIPFIVVAGLLLRFVL